MRSDHTAGIVKIRSHLGNRQRRGIGGKDNIGSTNALQLLPNLLLDLHVFQYGFDDQIDIFHILQ